MVMFKLRAIVYGDLIVFTYYYYLSVKYWACISAGRVSLILFSDGILHQI